MKHWSDILGGVLAVALVVMVVAAGYTTHSSRDRRPIPMQRGEGEPATFLGRNVISEDCTFEGYVWRCNHVLNHCSRQGRVK